MDIVIKKYLQFLGSIRIYMIITCGAPINKLDGPLGLDHADGSINILWNNITSVQHTAGHVLAMTRVTFHHLISWLEACIGDLGYT